MRALLGRLFAAYLKFVWATSNVTTVGKLETTSQIIATWHGRHFLVPVMARNNDRFHVLVSEGRWGALYAESFRQLGLKVLRGSGGRKSQSKEGASALRAMLRVLNQEGTIGLTIDVPGAARVAGKGAIALARISGRPIVPIACATRHCLVMRWRWDQPLFHAPFGRLAIVVGQPLCVEAEQSDDYYEMKRKELEHAVNLVNSRASGIVR